MKTTSTSFGKSARRSTSRRRGFTLVEILVAVSIMALLLAIILVPLRLGFETYHIGTARTAVQQEAQLTMQQMGKDFSRASFVFPNARIPGISDSTDATSGCSLLTYPSNGTGNNTDWKRLPYFKSTITSATGDPANSADIGITNPSVAFGNPSRIDMLFLRRAANANFPASIGEDYVVTYYPRRVDISKPYEPIDNPIVLYRAQYPYRYYRGSPIVTPTNARFVNFPSLSNPTAATNAVIDWNKYPAALNSGTVDANVNRDFLWITHNYYGEANLEPLTRDMNRAATATPEEAIQDAIPRSHTLVIPRGMQLVAPKHNNSNDSNNTNDSGALLPELSFAQSSISGTRIDRVTVNMTLAQYDQIGGAAVNGQPKAQRLPVSQTFDLPNAGCSTK